MQPKDFVAVRVTLGTDGIELEGGKRFGELATDLLGSAPSGKQLSLHIPGPPGRDPGH